MIYFYKDSNNLFHIGEDIIPSGKHILRTYNDSNTVSLESSDSHLLTMDPIEVTNLIRENDTPYASIQEVLDEVGDFFVSGYADLVAVEDRVTHLEDTTFKILYYEQIQGIQTSGQISIPTGATILFNQWENGEDAVVSNITDGIPDYEETGVVVNSLDASGNYTLSGVLDSNQAAFIYYILIDLINLENLNSNYIIDQSKLFKYPENIITIAEAGGDYTNIKDAVDSITDNDSTHRYLVLVAPGIYTEDNPIQCKSYVNIEAQSMHTVRVVAGNSNQDLFLGAHFSYLIGFSFVGVTGVTNYAVNHNSPGEAVIKDCVFTDCSNGVCIDGTSSLMNILNCALYTPTIVNMQKGINILAGNVTISFLKVVSGSTMDIVLNADGTDVTVLLDTIIAASPNINIGFNIDNDASISGFGVKLVAMTDGMIISGSGTSIKLDALQILSCQNDGFRIENVGTGIGVNLFATTVAQCAGLNFNILNPNSKIVGNGFTEVANSYLVPGAQFYTYLLDSTEGDAGLHIFGELKVGSIENPAESSLGEGDSTVRGMKVYTFDGVSTWVDVSIAASSASGSTFTYPALTANAAIYIGSELQQSGDYYKHSGIKYSLETAGVMGVGGEIVAEYWNGSVWMEINGMVTESAGAYHSSAKAYFQEVGSFQLRLDTELSRAAAGWTVTNPMSYDVALYWIRYRITSLIDTAPIFQQWKYHTNRFEPNADGYIEYFGNARPIGQLAINIGTSKPIAGNMQSETIWIDENIGVGYQTNKFTTTTDILGLSSRVPFNMDTSSNIYFIWSGLFSIAHTPVFTIRWFWIEQGANLYTSNPTASGNAKSTTVTRAVLADINETFIAVLDISDMIPKRPINYGDELWITMQITTLTGNFSITTGTADYIKWAEGGHI